MNHRPSLATRMTPLCLCCGSYFGDTDCPNVSLQPHSLELALNVADWLLEHGTLASPDSIREAVAELELERGP